MGDSNILDIASKDITDVIILSGLVGDPIKKNIQRISGYK